MSSPAIPAADEGRRYYTRFTPPQRFLHVALMTSFLGLGATGLALKFSTTGWSAAISRAVGGAAAMVFWHKLWAVVLTIAFGAHVIEILYRVLFKKEWGLVWGPNSLVPNLKDIQDFIGHFKYFLFLGPQPKFDRYAYWSKVDYWGVFWGMGIIGFSGYAMWFAPFFSKLIPGSWLNIALLIHGEEALLAVGFIFVVHFFNEHLRPHNFPMDITIFTGQQSEEQFKGHHPEEYQRVVAAGQLEALRSKAPAPWVIRLSVIVGTVAIAIGIVLIVLTAVALIRE